MTIETMRYVPDTELEDKNVADSEAIQRESEGGPYTYECSVCRQPVVENIGVRLVNVVLRCPHCGAYNEALRDVGVPT